jgi:4-phosphopantoate--beta-alanine ligase
LSNKTNVDSRHPRAESIRVREQITRGVEEKVVALAGLIAHGRGEAFDYILGEKTTPPASKAIEAAAASLLMAKYPVLSVNGNVAALCSGELVELSRLSSAKLEVNLFHRTLEREKAIGKVLREAGAEEVLGVGDAASAQIEEIKSDRRRVDPKGILVADVVFVPLEDGDRTEGLVKMGKTVIAVDLNPLSRTAQLADITIVDNVVRALPLLVNEVERLKAFKPCELKEIIVSFDNRRALSEAMHLMEERLHCLAERGVFIELD